MGAVFVPHLGQFFVLNQTGLLESLFRKHLHIARIAVLREVCNATRGSSEQEATDTHLYHLLHLLQVEHTIMVHIEHVPNSCDVPIRDIYEPEFVDQ